MKSTNRLKLALGIAVTMLLASAVASWTNQPEFGTMMIFMLIALAAAMGLLSSDSPCNEFRCIRKLIGRKAAAEPKAVDIDSSPSGPQKR